MKTKKFKFKLINTYTILADIIIKIFITIKVYKKNVCLRNRWPRGKGEYS